MADDFDYGRDIAPLRGKYFSDPGLNDFAKSHITSRLKTEVMPVYAEINEIQNRRMAARSADLAYQQQQHAFREQRRRTRQSQEAMATVATGQAALESILGLADSGDTDGANKAMARFTIENAARINSNEAWASMANAATSHLSRVSAEAAADERELNAFGLEVAKLGKPELLYKLKGMGATEEQLSRYELLADAVTHDRERKLADERAKLQHKGVTTMAIEEVNRLQDMVDDLEPLNAEAFKMAGVTRQGSSPVPTPEAVYNPRVMARVTSILGESGYSTANKTQDEILSLFETYLTEQRSKALQSRPETSTVGSHATAGMPVEDN